ncbi:hypothetical protein N431DRAFT_438264 [Stipitochalara longipes BDJ]|nr:hypothetical protein N431DRAFT_438264 [Stipitochalara longipes BDJ]
MSLSQPPISQPPITRMRLSARRPDPQLSSSLLSLLPFEIRQQIYKDVIASFGWGKKLHILSRDPEPYDSTGKQKAQLTYIPCTPPPPPPTASDLFGRLPSPRDLNTYYPSWPTQHQWCQGWKATVQAPPPLQGTYLNLFLSCRRIYEEAVGLLYSDHSFAINSLGTMHRFLATVPQQHLDLIRSLHVTMIIPYIHLKGAVIPSELHIMDQLKWQEVEIEWLRSCVALAKMSGLKNLEMDFWNATYDEVVEEELLKGLSSVRVSDGGNFIIRVPWKGENPVLMVEKMSLAGVKLERRQFGLEPVSAERYLCSSGSVKTLTQIPVNYEQTRMVLTSAGN